MYFNYPNESWKVKRSQEQSKNEIEQERVEFKFIQKYLRHHTEIYCCLNRRHEFPNTMI